MYKYKAIVSATGVNGTFKEKTFTTLSEIEYEIKQLKDGKGYDLEISSTPRIQNIETFSVMNSSYHKGIFKKRYISSYLLEIALEEESYGRFTDNFEEVKELIQDFVNLQRIPDYSDWNNH